MVALMSDLISAKEAVVEIVNNALRKILSGEQTLTREYEQSVLNAVKMVLDATQPEIIHCKDCKYYIPWEWMFDGLTRSSNINDFAPDEIGCSLNDHNYPPDGFCCHAERRINDSD